MHFFTDEKKTCSHDVEANFVYFLPSISLEYALGTLLGPEQDLPGTWHGISGTGRNITDIMEIPIGMNGLLVASSPYTYACGNQAKVAYICLFSW